MAAKYPLQDLFLIAAGPFVIGAIACVTLARLYAAHFKGTGLGERHASDTVGAR